MRTPKVQHCLKSQLTLQINPIVRFDGDERLGQQYRINCDNCYSRLILECVSLRCLRVSLVIASDIPSVVNFSSWMSVKRAGGETTLCDGCDGCGYDSHANPVSDSTSPLLVPTYGRSGEYVGAADEA
ncbi:hypothetical protein V1478_011650 [Vespula squamosa]|uniref:Uncharacterized protein n=1 Tax=Vespula squamosa TaxID=30214 RepID=A0ABD2AF32_VESSQ